MWADPVEPLEISPASEQRQLVTDRLLAPLRHVRRVEAVLPPIVLSLVPTRWKILMRSVCAATDPSSERPSISYVVRTRATSRIVGSTSIVSTWASTMRPRRCPGNFTSRGTGARSSTFPGVTVAALDADVEADAVVGHHDHERVAEQPELSHPPEQLAEQTVRQSELQQMALVGDLHEPRVAEPLRPVQPGDGLRRMAPVVAARGVELPGHVREQHMLEPERGPLARLDRAHELSEAPDLSAPEVAQGRSLQRLAEARRAEPGGLLGGVHLVAVAPAA